MWAPLSGETSAGVVGGRPPPELVLEELEEVEELVVLEELLVELLDEALLAPPVDDEAVVDAVDAVDELVVAAPPVPVGEPRVTSVMPTICWQLARASAPARAGTTIRGRLDVLSGFDTRRCYPFDRAARSAAAPGPRGASGHRGRGRPEARRIGYLGP